MIALSARLSTLASALLLASACGDAPATHGSVAADSAVSGEPSAPRGNPAPAGAQARAATSALVAPGASTSASASASAGAPPSAALLDLTKAPELFDADGKPLGQTDEPPSITSPAFQERLGLLFRAIVTDDPALAEPAFFPKVAYEQVKDIKNPGADWKSRLLRAFSRNIHEYHDDLGADPAACRLLGIEVDDKRIKVMARGKEGNKLPYHRVTRSKIRWADASGKERAFELTSLISWRGEWFVVHLHGFK